MSETPIDPALLRRALGAFVTGITVVTTRSVAGDPVGITVNSFNAVSLSPPLVLWSLSLRAASFDAFVQSSHFVVNVLGAQQIPLSERFATTGGDKFAGVAWRKTLADMPLLEGTAASFVCRNVHRFRRRFVTRFHCRRFRNFNALDFCRRRTGRHVRCYLQR